MDKKQKDEQAAELKNYRDIIIFTFLMVNVFYIVLVTMLQVYHDNIFSKIQNRITNNTSPHLNFNCKLQIVNSLHL